MALTTTRLRARPTPITGTSEGAAEAEMTRVVRYVTESWFTPIPDVVRVIRARLRDKVYQDSSIILNDIRRDLSLYGHCLRLARGKIYSRNGDTNPGHILKQISFADAEELIPAQVSKVSRHSFNLINSTQVGRLQQIVVGSTVVQMLEESEGRDSDDAFLAYYLRQLGITLTCWNYPRLYAKVLATPIMSIGDLDRSLGALLGLSPSMVGMQAALNWGFEESFLRPILIDLESKNNRFTYERIREIERSNQLLAHMLIGDALAVGADTDSFPGAESSWNWGVEEFQRRMGGSQSLSILGARIRTNWLPYATAFPKFYEEIFSEHGRRDRRYSEFARGKYESNRSIQFCSRYTQDNLARTYRDLMQDKPSEKSLRTLIEQAIPGAGFGYGCIFLVDPATFSTRPLVFVGDARTEGFNPLYSSRSSLTLDPVLKAAQSGVIVRGTGERDQAPVMYFSGRIGTPMRQAVLYLESVHQPFFDGREDPLSCFKALQRTLTDALNIQSDQEHSEEPAQEGDRA